MSAGRPGPNGRDDWRPRPPGPEEKRGATATSPNRDNDDQKMPTLGERLRSPRTWLWLIATWLLIFLLQSVFLPQPADRTAISYTFFKEQVQAGNVAKITSRGEAVQGEFKAAVKEPTAPPSSSPSPSSAPTSPPSPTRSGWSRSWRSGGCGSPPSRWRSRARPCSPSSSPSGRRCCCSAASSG
jgi:hypothetical protein